MKELADRADQQPTAQPHTTSPKKGMWRAVRRGTRAAARCIFPCLFRQKINKKKKKDSLANDTPITGVQEPVNPVIKEPTSSASSKSAMKSVAPVTSVNKPTSPASITSDSVPSQLSLAKKGSKNGSSTSFNSIKVNTSGSSTSFDSKKGNNSCSSAPSDRNNEPFQPSLSKTSIKDRSRHLTLDSFTFHHLLGEGAYGKVLLASHIASKEKFAVKIVKKRYLIKDDINEVMTERRVLEKTRHNSFITHLFGCFQTEECLFFAMEYLSGGDLQRLINAKGPLPENTLRFLTAEILCGLKHLHTIGIIHRDIKPLNILLSRAGHAKIADFGLAAMGVYEPTKITGCAGTPPYMAPEMFLRQPYDAMVDYFSLGITVYEMAVGRHPYNQPFMNPYKMKLAITTRSPRYPSWIDDNLLNLIESLMEKDQKKRRKIVSNIRNHPFFEKIKWAELKNGETPQLQFSGRHLKFPSLNTLNMAHILSSEYSPISPEEQQHFRNFSFLSDRLKVEIPSPPSKPPTSGMASYRSMSALWPLHMPTTSQL